MNNEVKWIKLKVGMFDGTSFKKIKRAKIDGVADFRDKLTAVWFELLDLGAKVNNEGYFFNNEIAFNNLEDIAIMLDRTDKEIEMCFNFYLKEEMIVIINDVYSINNWTKYQNNEGLEKIREQNRIRQQRYRDIQKQIQLDNKVTEICSYCGKKATTIDHIIPLSKGGLDNKENIVESCLDCNMQKNNRVLAVFLNERLRFNKDKDIIKRVQNNIKLNKIVRYDNKINKFITLHITLRNALPLIDNNTSISNSLSNSNSLKEDLKDNKQDINNKDNKNNNKFNWKKEVYFEDEELQKTFLDYLELRQSIKAVNTERAIKLLINNLEKIASDKDTKIKVIEQSIMNSWKGVFPLKNDFNKKEVKNETEWDLSKFKNDFTVE